MRAWGWALVKFGGKLQVRFENARQGLFQQDALPPRDQRGGVLAVPSVGVTITVASATLRRQVLLLSEKLERPQPVSAANCSARPGTASQSAASVQFPVSRANS